MHETIGRTRLTVVLPNYNGRELLEPMLGSLVAQSCPPERIVVVDNGSQDDSVSYLRECWPAVDVMEIPVNIGVTPVLNRCLKAAAGSDLVALFNNDMELEPECLQRLVEALEDHPEAGSATPKMLDFSDRGVLDGAGDLLSWRGGGRRRGHGERDRGQYDRAEPVFGPCGGAALLRRSALELIGDFHEPYFAYYEDVDWAFRAQLAGLSCRYVPGAVLYHRGSATLGQGLTDFNCYQLWRNTIWLIVRCYPASSLLRHLPELLLGQAANLYVAVRERRLNTWRRAIVDACAAMPACLRERRAIQRSRVLDRHAMDAAARSGWR